MRTLPILVAVLVLQVAGLAATIYVPDDYLTIQGAIDNASDSDTIIVRPGTYFENIDFKGLAIHLKSECGLAVTTINGMQNGSVVTFNSGEPSGSILEGFTITNGSGTYVKSYPVGGGILCNDNSSPTIKNNRITANFVLSDPGTGGGLWCRSAVDPITIEGNIIDSNIAEEDGGGIYAWGCKLEIINNLIVHNEATSWVGGGICIDHDCTATITNNTICCNSAVHGGGIEVGSSNTVYVRNGILWGNSPDQIRSSVNTVTSVDYSDVEGGWTGTGSNNIDANPLFAANPNVIIGEFFLSQMAAGQACDSPCVDAGDPPPLIEGTTRTDFQQDTEPLDIGFHYPIPPPLWPPMPDIKVNGYDGPLNLSPSDAVIVNIALDPGDLDGVPADWWVFADKDSNSTWWAQYRKGQAPKWTKAALPIRFSGATLRSVVNGYTVLGPRTLPTGEYVFTFAVDEKNDTYEGTYIDTVEVTVN